MIYWIYGIPGSGKTTLAKFIRNKMRFWDTKCIILDDEILMVLDSKTKWKLIKWLYNKCDFLLITTVAHPSFSPLFHDCWLYRRYIHLQCGLKIAKARHKKADKNVKDNEVKEYERYWQPWSSPLDNDDFYPYLTSRNTIPKIYQEIYEDFLKEDLLKLDLKKK